MAGFRLGFVRLVALLIVCAAAQAVAQAAPAHEHGVARLDVAVDAGRVTIEFDTPLDNLLGFERAPRSDAERAKVSAMVARLRAADTLFRIDSAAGCKLSKVDLVSVPIGLGGLGKAAGGSSSANSTANSTAIPTATTTASTIAHGDLNGSFEFLCSQGARAGFLEVGLFDAFPALKRIDLQVATPKGQIKAVLRKPASRVVLVR